VAAQLKAAAVAVHGALELLATHQDPQGRWRTPESARLAKLSARMNAAARVAEMAIMLADLRPLVVARILDGDWPVTRARDKPLPDMSALRTAANRARTAPARLRVGEPVIDAATVANPGIRTGDPLSELSDRITRIRTSAWRSATYSDVLTGVAAITDYASTAVIIHTTAAQTISELTGVPMSDPNAPPVLQTFRSRAATWRQARSTLLTMTSYAEPDLDLAEDAQAVRKLLAPALAQTSTPAPEGVSHPIEADPTDLAEALLRAAQTFEDIAGWNADTLQNLSTTGHLHLPAGLLTRKELGTRRNLLKAKTNWLPVPVPPARITSLLDTYETLHQPSLIHFTAIDLEPTPAGLEPPGL
jgi:hypothetical protein